MPYEPPRTGGIDRKRLGTYLLGVAIGCLLLGLFWSGRQRQVRRLEAERRAAEPVQDAPAAPTAP